MGAMAHVLDDLEVVRDEEVRDAELVLQIHEQVDDLRLDRDVERADRLVAHDELGLHGERARDADALPLAAGELVRVARHRVGAQADLARGAPRPSPLRPSSSSRARGSGSPRRRSSRTVMRGFRLEYGSWKMICIFRRSGRSSRCESGTMSRAVEDDAPERRLDEAQDRAGRACSCRSRSRRRGRASRRGARGARRRRPRGASFCARAKKLAPTGKYLPTRSVATSVRGRRVLDGPAIAAPLAALRPVFAAVSRSPSTLTGAICASARMQRARSRSSLGHAESSSGSLGGTRR